MKLAPDDFIKARSYIESFLVTEGFQDGLSGKIEPVLREYQQRAVEEFKARKEAVRLDLEEQGLLRFGTPGTGRCGTSCRDRPHFNNFTIFDDFSSCHVIGGSASKYGQCLRLEMYWSGSYGAFEEWETDFPIEEAARERQLKDALDRFERQFRADAKHMYDKAMENRRKQWETLNEEFGESGSQD